MSEMNGDLLDEGLQNVMGKDRWRNVWEQSKTVPAKKDEKKIIRADKVRDAQWEPVKEKTGQMERLKQCAKSVLCFGFLSLLFFFWQQTGQMEMTASIPCICVCVAMAGFRVGKAFGGH